MAGSILGVFRYEEDFLAAAKSLQAAGFNKFTLMSPIRLEQAEEIAGLEKSRVRYFSLIGAITGAISGFALAVACALIFILPTGGRAVIAFPPFLVIAYEVTILFGVLATLLGFHFVSGLPAWRDKAYQVETNIDRFSIALAPGSDADSTRIEQTLRAAGAEQIKHLEVAA